MSRSVEFIFKNLSRFSQLLRHNLFSSWSRFLKLRLWIKILLRWDFYPDCWECQDKSRQIEIFKIYWDISALSRLFEGLQAQKSQQIERTWSRKMIKSTNSWSRLRQTARNLAKISGLDRFLDLDQDFWDCKVVLRQNQDFSITETSILKLSRFTFC